MTDLTYDIMGRKALCSLAELLVNKHLKTAKLCHENRALC